MLVVHSGTPVPPEKAASAAMPTGVAALALALASAVATAIPTGVVEDRLQALEQVLEQYTYAELEAEPEPMRRYLLIPGAWEGQNVATKAFDNFGKLACQKLCG